MGIRAHKTAWMKADIVVAAVARWLAATNESVIVNEWYMALSPPWLLRWLIRGRHSGDLARDLDFGARTVFDADRGSS
ncbi:hypothetical protein VE00_10832 [Pseudogymnoascus sp. WSF 3629]|nr:hypothetical protein VE00_10832 [Pseudogymnoascus sp. WSF 3629]